MRARAAVIVVLPTPPLPATTRTRLLRQKVATSMFERAYRCLRRRCEGSLGVSPTLCAAPATLRAPLAHRGPRLPKLQELPGHTPCRLHRDGSSVTFGRGSAH